MKYANPAEKHQFALYASTITSLVSALTHGQSFTITDSDLIHRMITILRLTVGESLVLFDQKTQAKVTITNTVKNKSVQVTLDGKQSNHSYQPQLTFLLPLLKKEALETALYSLTEVGVNQIQLLTTQKSQQKWTPKEHERAHKIIIAAAEQSKNFAFPALLAPISIAQLPASKDHEHKLFFDPAGKTLASCLQNIQELKSGNIILAIGPEGDLTVEEKEKMKAAGFIFCSLTPTILRACQAAALSAGVIRSIIR